MSQQSQAVMDRLIQGNERFIKAYGQELEKHLKGQSPGVAVLTCSDSRVPAELIFDAGIGEVFAIEVAGNVAFDSSVLGSIDYAVEHLKVPLLLILGHTNCGAVNASEQGPGDDSAIGQIVNEIRVCFGTGDNVRANILRQMELLKERSQAVAEAVKNGQTELRGAIYHLESGTIEWL